MTGLIDLSREDRDKFGLEFKYEPFPEIDPGIVPLGSRVLVQVQSPRAVSAGGIIRPIEVQEGDRYLTQLAVVRKVGPLAFKRRVTGDDWPEGAWVKPGDFVRVPLYGGDRLALRSKEGHTLLFLLLEDHNLIAKLSVTPEKFWEMALD